LQITVLDNCSPDAEVRPLKEAGFDLEILPRNLGYGGAANHALRQWLCSTDTPYAVVCPHDALPSANCVELILKAMHERPRAGVGCAESGQDTAPGYSLLRGYNLYPAERTGGWCPAEFPNGTLFVISRQCLADVGLFDERYFAYGEEYDFGRRAIESQWEVGQIWGAVVKNPTRVVSSEVAWYLTLRNGLLASYQRDGLYAALLRSCVISLNGLARWLGHRPSATNPTLTVRIKALCAFWTGSFGPPPEST